MCRSSSEGGRRCPGCTSEKARARHNERRRHNRAMRAGVVARARDQGVPDEVIRTIARTAPSHVRGWAAEHLSQADNGLRGITVPAMGTPGAIKDPDARTQVLLDDLERAVQTIAESGQIEQWLDAMASDGMQRWSANNRILAASQLIDRAQREGRPELLSQIHMMTAKQWKDRFGRWPAKGSKALYILRPRTRRIVDTDQNGDEETRTVVVGFGSMPVFNITQTDGPDLPQHPGRPLDGDVPAGVWDGLRGRVADAGYTFEEMEINGCNPEQGTGTLGYTDPRNRRVVVDSRLSHLQKTSVLAHELGHIFAGHVETDMATYQRHRGQMETEAEAAAYLTLRRVGVSPQQSESFAPSYIAGWMTQKGASFSQAMDRAVKATTKILSGWFEPDADDDVKGGRR